MIEYVIGTIVLLVLDYIWISSNKQAYASATEAVQKSKMEPKTRFIVLSYAIFLVGIYLVIQDLKHYKSWQTRLVRSALWGFVFYGIYNSVNAALFKNYDMSVAIKDTLWGAFVVCVSTNTALYASRWFS